MPNIKAAEKWMRQTGKRTTHNKDVTSRLKTIFKKAVTSQDSAIAQSVEGAFDKAAKTGVIHKNKAARKKSRLVKAMIRAAAAPVAVKKTSGKAKTVRKAGKKK
ncbi:MAG: 30S ribosomal protein S20 [Candidatus Eremiobacteraeota bacterium]|nr:30S ribosomal protein S20 [Candidatus Eremiobacteraeota bacterium]